MASPAEAANLGLNEATTGLRAEKAQFPGADNRLKACADAQPSIDGVKSLFDPAACQTDDHANLAGAFSLLRPGEAFKLPLGQDRGWIGVRTPLRRASGGV